MKTQEGLGTAQAASRPARLSPEDILCPPGVTWPRLGLPGPIANDSLVSSRLEGSLHPQMECCTWG